jgi:hypothetical protein
MKRTILSNSLLLRAEVCLEATSEGVGEAGYEGVGVAAYTKSRVKSLKRLLPPTAW